MADSSKTTGLELCVACQKKYPLDKWQWIMEKSLNERIKILRKRKLCYGCLKPVAKDHNAKNCQQRLTCRTCTACHSTMLHMYVPKTKTDNSKSNLWMFTKKCSWRRKCNMCISKWQVWCWCNQYMCSAN